MRHICSSFFFLVLPSVLPSTSMTSPAAPPDNGSLTSGLLEWPITPSLTVHCFTRDGKLAGHGPLFILREWDMKVIRTIGHKPRCKGLNTEQALRACVRQGLLSLQLRTENATKEEIQLLKSVNVLGKRAPSGSLIGAADLMRLLEYFSKRDVAEAFRQVVKRKCEEGVVSDEVWKEVSGIKEKDVIHKFKINTDEVDDSAQEHDSRDEQEEEDRDKRRRSKSGSSSRAAASTSSGSSKGKRSTAVSNGESRRSKKRKSNDGNGDVDEGRSSGGAGRSSKRRRSSISSSSLRSSSSGSSLSSLDSHDNESRRRRHRNGHRRHRNDRSDSPTSRDRRDKRTSGEYPQQPQQQQQQQEEYITMPAGADLAHYNGQYEVVNGGGGRVTYAPVMRGVNGQQTLLGVPQNGKAVSVLPTGRGRGGAQQYYSVQAPPGGYTVASQHVVGGSPPSYNNGLYTATGRPASYTTLSALPPHILQQYAPSLSSSLHSIVSMPGHPPGQSPTGISDPSLSQSDGLEVLMQVISDKGGRTATKHSSAIDPNALGQHPLIPVRGQLVTQYEQAPPQLSSTEQLYRQQQQMQQQVYLSGQSQLSPSALAYRPSLLPNGAKMKDSPTYLSSNAFSFNTQPAPHNNTIIMKKEYSQHPNSNNTLSSSSNASSGPVPLPVRVPSTLPSVQSSASLSSSILSPGTPESSTTPTSSSVHRPQPRLSPANSFNNLPALVSSSASSTIHNPPITRTLSSNSLSLGLPNSSSVSSLSSLLNGSGSLSYNALHTSMSMTSLNAADVSDADDDDGDAGINGILHFDDDINDTGGTGNGAGDGSSGGGRSGVNYYSTYNGGSDSPLPRISSIQSLSAAGSHSPMPRIASNLSTLTSSFLPSPPPSRPGSPAARPARIEPAAATASTDAAGSVSNGGSNGAALTSETVIGAGSS